MSLLKELRDTVLRAPTRRKRVVRTIVSVVWLLVAIVVLAAGVVALVYGSLHNGKIALSGATISCNALIIAGSWVVFILSRGLSDEARATIERLEREKSI